MYPTKRDLDGVYFRVKRDGEFDNVCYSDLTPGEREKVGQGRPIEWWKSISSIMADRLHEVGDTLDIFCE